MNLVKGVVVEQKDLDALIHTAWIFESHLNNLDRIASEMQKQSFKLSEKIEDKNEKHLFAHQYSWLHQDLKSIRKDLEHMRTGYLGMNWYQRSIAGTKELMQRFVRRAGLA